MKQLELMTAPSSNLNPATKIMSNKKIFNSLGWLVCASYLLVSFSVYAGTDSHNPKFSDIKKIERMHIDKIIGKDVVNPEGQKLGEISNLVLSAPDNVLYAIVSVGGFLEIDAKLVAVPVDNLIFRTFKKGNKAVLDASKEELKEAPEYYYDDPAKDVPNLIGN